MKYFDQIFTITKTFNKYCYYFKTVINEHNLSKQRFRISFLSSPLSAPLPVLTSLFIVWWQKIISFICGNQTGLCLQSNIENKTSWQSHVFMSLFSMWVITLRVKGEYDDMKGDFGRMAFVKWARVHTRNHVTSQQAPFLGSAKLVFNALYERRRRR